MEDVPFLSEAIGTVIENLRHERGMTRSALADFAAMERRYLYGLVNATSNATVRTVYLLCRAFDVPPAEFFEEVEEVRRRLEEEATQAEHISPAQSP